MTIASSDNRTPLLALLEEYQARNQSESEQIELFRKFVEENPHCFERSLLTGHVTGSAWVINAQGTNVLLTHHKKLNKWLQLGGHADGDPDILAVALKEAREESGLIDIRPVSTQIFDLDIHPIPKRLDEPAHFHYDVRFLFQTSGSEEFVKSDESIKLAWVSQNEIPALSNEESLLRMARKWLLQTKSK